MPGRLFLTAEMTNVAASLGVSVGAFADEHPRRNIAPGEQVVALTPDGLTSMRWGIIPVGRKNARGRPVMETIINARSETVFDKTAFEGVGRAVLPVNGWYEWTGEKRRKTAWQIAPKDDGFLYFAAITDVWKAPGGLEVPQLATVTCEPNADVRDIHHRMGVLLSKNAIDVWLNGSDEEAAALMRPWPDGQLDVSEADPAWFD
ncbi:MAG: SOS response-associated peptidase [Pseudomonadota bacterium]